MSKVGVFCGVNMELELVLNGEWLWNPNKNFSQLIIVLGVEDLSILFGVATSTPIVQCKAAVTLATPDLAPQYK